MQKDLTQRRRLQGVVVSDKMSKTIVVRVDRMKTHAKYKKQYTESKNYKVHDEKNEFRAGDLVVFEECRPISRGKCWRAINPVRSAIQESVINKLDS